MKVIIFLATSALLATLDFVSTASVCDEALFDCNGIPDTRYHEYLVFKGDLKWDQNGKCPRRIKKINKLMDKTEKMMQFAWNSVICHQRLHVKSQLTFSIILL